ncbi:ABC transporter substrate-binding protein [Citrobacter amalonaticus]|nr:ABC transporter substrate-binding protein [Citrobacter amalonaticus]
MQIIVRILLLFVMLISASVQAQAIKESYAFAVLGEPKYAFNFDHFDYANPAAPKGGQIPFPRSAPSTTSTATPCEETPAPGPNSFTTPCLPPLMTSPAAIIR